MGQAKQRGARADRVAESLGLKQRKIEDVKKDLGLPEDAEFCGYLIHIQDKDEFLHDIIDTPSLTQHIFAKTPELAKRFEVFNDAYELARSEKGEIVVGMFDLGKQLFVFPIS